MHQQLVHARLVAEVLAYYRPVGGQTALGLLVYVAREVHARVLVQAKAAKLVLQTPGAAGLLYAPQVSAEEQTGVVGAAHAVPAPEGRGRAARIAGLDQHPVAGDVDYLPGERAQQEAVAQARLEHVLLVQLAQVCAVLQVHAVIAPVGYGAARLQREQPAVPVAAEHAVYAVVYQPGALRRVLAVLVVPGQHAQQALQHVARERARGPCAAQHAKRLIHRVLPRHAHGHQLLRRHVQAQARRARALYRTLPDAARHEGVQQYVLRRAGQKVHPAHLARAMARAPQPLRRARDRRGRAYLQHQVYLAHVYAQLHGAGGAHHAQRAALELPLGLQALLAGYAAVVGAGKALSAQPVYAVRQLFGSGAPLAECQRGAAGGGLVIRAAEYRGPYAALGHDAQVGQRQLDRELRALDYGRADYAAGPGRARGVEPGQVLRRRVQRLYRGRKAYARHVPPAQLV